MLRATKLIFLFLSTCISSVLMAGAALAAAPTVDQIIEKNVSARGGLKAWREVQTITMTGTMDAGTKTNVQLPFVLSLKRPLMSRLEIKFAGKTAQQVYDGTTGWKVRPFLGRNEVEPYTAAEAQLAAGESELDGYLIDHESKGIKVELIGTEPVENRDAYKLRLTMKDGKTRHLWVDAQSFLEVKIEGTPRKLDGKMHNVDTYCRNYTLINGLRFPLVLETVVDKVKPTRKITIENVVLNPKLESNAFSKPELPGIIVVPALKQSASSAPGQSQDAAVRQ